MPLCMLQTTDLHNHIGLQMAGRLHHLRTENQALLVDCGDAIWAPNILVKPGPEEAIQRMNEAGYAAMAMGNREFFFRALGMMMKTAGARFPVLSANLICDRGDLGQIKRWTVVTSPQGQRVGLFGLTPMMIPPQSWGEAFSNLRFITHERATREAIAALRRDCDWLVCLSHMGIERDHALAAGFGEIDLILGGHSHRQMELTVINGVTLSHIGPYGRHVALVVSKEDQRPSEFTRQMLRLGE
jgi:5'-nucleotidase